MKSRKATKPKEPSDFSIRWIELRKDLRAAKARNASAYLLIGEVSGLGERNVREIAAERRPSLPELITLECTMRG